MTIDPNRHQVRFLRTSRRVLARVVNEAPPEALHRDGTWHHAPTIDEMHDAHEIDLDEAEELANGADLYAEGDRPPAPAPPGMTEQEIRDAGLAIDVPFEGGSPDPQPLRYTDGSTAEEHFQHLVPKRGAGGSSE